MKARKYLNTLLFAVLFAWISFVPANIQAQYKIYTWVFSGIFLFCLKQLFGAQDWPFWLFLISISSGIICATNRNLAFTTYIYIALTTFLLFYIGKGLCRDKGAINRVALVICICSLLIALIGVLELYFAKNLLYENFILNPYYNRYIKYHPRPMSTQLHPSILGSYLLGCLPFSFYFLKNKSSYLRLLGILSTLLCLGVIMLTFSRGVFLALAAMFLAYSWLAQKKKTLVLFSLFLLLLISVCSYQKDPNLNRFGFKRMILGSYDSIISKYRFNRVNMTLKILRDYPFFGIGFNHFRIKFNDYCHESEKSKTPYEFMIPDNMYLTFLAETGIIGTSGFLIFIFLLLKRGFKSFKGLVNGNKKEILLICLLALIGLLVNMAAYDLFYWYNPYMLFCLICGFMQGAIKDPYEH